jgi:hypothetical protein
MNLNSRAFKEKVAYIEKIFLTPYHILQSTTLDLNFLLNVLMNKNQTSNLILIIELDITSISDFQIENVTSF